MASIIKLIFIVLSVLMTALVQAEHKENEKHLLKQAAVTTVSDLNGFNGKTYSWMKAMTHYYSNHKLSDPALQGMLQEAIANNLSAKGYVFNSANSGGDFSVGYVAALDSSLSSEEIAKIYGIDPGLPELSKDLSKFEKGTLIVHVFDSKSGELLWRGALQAEVKLQNDHNSRWQRVQSSVNTLLRGFPALEHN